MATQPQQPTYSFEEYVALERYSEEKHEFHDGHLVAMSGGTEPHARLCIRMATLLDRLFPECRVYGENLMVRIERHNRGVYPDAMVIYGEPAFWKDQNDVVVNPFLVVEVLSPSTARFDRNRKRELYQTIPSLRHMLIISQDSPYVEHSQLRSDQKWVTTSHTTTVDLPMGYLMVEDIYRGIL